MASMKTGAPAQKVTFATAAAALATLLVSVLSNTELGKELVRFQAEFVTIITFLAGYMMPPSQNDGIESS